MSEKLKRLMADIPEVYQPLFGHSELSEGASRDCADRLVHITAIHDALCAALGRPLRVLDLGCAQGFFSLSLAARGAQVHGVDFLDKNIAVCTELAREHPESVLKFETNRLENTVASLALGQYDLVLGLSVFHHLVHEHGVPPVQAMLSRLAECAAVLLVEFALREEPLYWGPSQPQTPQELLRGCSFVHQLARCATHLSPIERPLFVASNQCVVWHDAAYFFSSWAFDPHRLAHNTHESSRSYFLGEGFIAKQYQLDHPSRGAHNRVESERERQFLSAPPTGAAVPRVFEAEYSETEAWIVMERLQGRLLLDALTQGSAIDAMSILRQILEQLCALERVGLYHNDIRAWNVLLDDAGCVHLIDFGSIVDFPADCVWPRNLFLAFFIFVRELVTGQIDNPDPLRTIAISPYSLPDPYRSWAIRVWQDPPALWSFATMLQYLSTNTELVSEPSAHDIWSAAIESALQTQKQFAQSLRDRVDDQQLSRLGANLLQEQTHQMALRAVASETLADERARELKQGTAHAQLLAEMSQFQMEQLIGQTNARIAQLESARVELLAELQQLRLAEADSSAQAHIDGVQAAAELARAQAQLDFLKPLFDRMQIRVADLEAHNQSLHERAIEQANGAHTALLAAEVRAIQSEARILTFEAELALSKQLRMDAETSIRELQDLLEAEKDDARAAQVAVVARIQQTEQHVAKLGTELENVLEVSRQQQVLIDERGRMLEEQSQLLQQQGNELQSEREMSYHHQQLCRAREQQLQAMQLSRSWRLTAPLRELKGSAMSQLPSRLRAIFSEPREHFTLYVNRRPRLKKMIRPILKIGSGNEKTAPPVFLQKHTEDAVRSEKESNISPLERILRLSEGEAADIRATPGVERLSPQSRRLYEQMNKLDQSDK